MKSESTVAEVSITNDQDRIQKSQAVAKTPEEVISLITGRTALSKSTSDLRCCKSCCVAKPLTEYYYHSQSNSHESSCKKCKKDKRRGQADKVGKVESPSTEQGSKPDRIIEPEITQQATGIRGTNFDLWEKMYGRKLNDLEKLEIRTNLCGFFNLLLDEYKKGFRP